MKFQRRIWVAALVGSLALSGVAVASAAQAQSSKTVSTANVTAQQPAAGTNAALAWEALMSPDGEYAAAAAYAAVIAKYGKVQPYVNIRAAERRHIAALTRQLERYGFEVPANPYMKKIPAPDSLKAAAQAWATGEVDNVKMYDDLIARASDPQLIRVLTNLRRSSLESHLPMFEAAAKNGGTLTTSQMATFQGSGRSHAEGKNQGQRNG
jgi:hypothetical protein